MRLELQATPEEVMRAVEALQAYGREHQVTEKDLFGLALALEECGSNIVQHALNRDAGQKFQVAFHHAGGAMTIELRDRGPEFDPTHFSAAEQGGEDRPPGGWGIQLARRHVDAVRYERQGAENVLRLTKRLVPAGPPE